MRFACREFEPIRMVKVESEKRNKRTKNGVAKQGLRPSRITRLQVNGFASLWFSYKLSKSDVCRAWNNERVFSTFAQFWEEGEGGRRRHTRQCNMCDSVFVLVMCECNWPQAHSPSQSTSAQFNPDLRHQKSYTCPCNCVNWLVCPKASLPVKRKHARKGNSGAIGFSQLTFYTHSQTRTTKYLIMTMCSRYVYVICQNILKHLHKHTHTRGCTHARTHTHTHANAPRDFPIGPKWVRERESDSRKGVDTTKTLAAGERCYASSHETWNGFVFKLPDSRAQQARNTHTHTHIHEYTSYMHQTHAVRDMLCVCAVLMYVCVGELECLFWDWVCYARPEWFTLGVHKKKTYAHVSEQLYGKIVLLMC